MSHDKSTGFSLVLRRLQLPNELQGLLVLNFQYLTGLPLLKLGFHCDDFNQKLL